MAKTLRKKHTKRNIRKNKKSIKRRRINKNIYNGGFKDWFKRLNGQKRTTADPILTTADPILTQEEELMGFKLNEGENSEFIEREGEIPVRYYEVFGMGCSDSLETNSKDKRFCEPGNGKNSEKCSNAASIYENSRIKMVKTDIAEKIGLMEENIQVICNNLDSAFSNIAALWIKSRVPFIQSFYNMPVDNNASYKNMKFSVISDIEKGKRVFIKGHSFGGAIVNRLAISLQNYARSNPDSDFTRNLSKLFILAVASIYVAPYHLINKIPIYNAMNTGDVAIKVNGYHVPIDKLTKITTSDGTYYGNYYYQSEENHSLIWIHNTAKYQNYLNTVESKLNPPSVLSKLVGSGIEWKTHGDYTVGNTYLEQIKKQSQVTSDSINVDSIKEALFPGLRQLV